MSRSSGPVQAIITLENAAAARLERGALWFAERDVIGRKPRLPGVARLLSRKKQVLGLAFVSPGSRYFLRLIERGDVAIDRAFWRERIARAEARRARLREITDAFRVVHAESDGMPSIVVDRYNDIVAFQITSAGAEAIKADLIELLAEHFHPASIIEKDAIAIRKAEGLALVEAVVQGEKTRTQICEGDQRFELDVLAGQKTGAYLDYRGFRLQAREWAAGDCLDAFCYQGWFACQIARRARSVVAVDASQPALDAAAANAALNGHRAIAFERADAFEYLAACSRRFDFIHLDPPAMAKERAKIAGAEMGYRKLMSGALRLLHPGGVILISSCSHKITERILEQNVLQSLKKEGRQGEIIWRGIQDADHPVLRSFPESLYLKALAVRIR